MRYMIYWYQQTAEEFAKSTLAAEEMQKQAFLARTVDYVGTGEQQSEVGHQATYSSSSTYGSYNGEIYRDVQRGGYIQYVLSNAGGITSDLSVMCRFTTADANRTCTVYIDGTSLGSYTIPSSFSPSENGFFNYEFPIPDKLLVDAAGEVKSELVFRIEASGTAPAPGLYEVRLLKDYSKQYSTNYKFVAKEWALTGDAGRVTQDHIVCDEDNNIVTVTANGNNNVCLNFNQEKYTINTEDKYFFIQASNVNTADGKTYLWWFNGTNHGSSVRPTQREILANGDVVFYWDITQSGLDDKLTGRTYSFSQGNTIFGLTSTTGTTIIKNIGFNSEMTLPNVISSLRADINAPKGIYDINGHKLKAVAKGINIVDGQKVIVK